MFENPGIIIATAIAIGASGLLIWGFSRARKDGKLGILSWLQSAILMAPWLLFFGLFAAGIYLNPVGILFLLVASTVAYIILGNRLRASGQDAFLRERARQRLQEAREQEDAAALRELEKSAPSTPTSLESAPIPKEDLQAIQGIFSIDTFFATETIPYQEGAIFKGNLRSDSEPAIAKLSARLQKTCGDRYRLFLVEGTEGRPVVIVLPSSEEPAPTTAGQKLLAAVMAIASLFATLEAFSLLLGFDLVFSPQRFREAVPLTLGLWSILAAHEIGHRLAARRYQARLGVPFVIPSLQIGSFGTITRFESFLPTRNVLFDIALAGPASGGILSLLLLLVGLLLSNSESAFQVPTQFFQASLLVGALAKVVLGAQLEQVLTNVHPLAIVGWLGLVITALNLMPAGQLDGGRIVQAIYGRRTARRTTIATLIVLVIVAFSNPSNPIPLYWGGLILFLQRGLERPSLNELAEPDDARAALGLLALFLMLATLIPWTPSLAGRLGIGG